MKKAIRLFVLALSLGAMFVPSVMADGNPVPSCPLHTKCCGGIGGCAFGTSNLLF